MKRLKTLILISLFFIFSFFSLFYLQNAKNTSTKIMQNITNMVESGLNKLPDNTLSNPMITEEMDNLLFKITYFRTKYQSSSDPHNFAEVQFENISPVLCHFIIKNQQPLLMRLFINNQETFFGSPSSICFKKMNNDIRFYFEIYNYTPYFYMNEPTLCLADKDCPSDDEICINGYCKKNTNNH